MDANTKSPYKVLHPKPMGMVLPERAASRQTETSSHTAGRDAKNNADKSSCFSFFFLVTDNVVLSSNDPQT